MNERPMRCEVIVKRTCVGGSFAISLPLLLAVLLFFLLPPLLEDGTFFF